MRQNLLGMEWDVNGDRISLHQPQYPVQNLTKRFLQSQIHLLFDPLDIISPITIKGKNVNTRSLKGES